MPTIKVRATVSDGTGNSGSEEEEKAHRAPGWGSAESRAHWEITPKGRAALRFPEIDFDALELAYTREVEEITEGEAPVQIRPA